MSQKKENQLSPSASAPNKAAFNNHHTKSSLEYVTMPCRGCTKNCPNIAKCGAMPWQK